MPTINVAGVNQSFVSPGVFLPEVDQSGIAQGVANIGAVVVAPFLTGPGFSPTLVSDMTTLQQTFGVPDGTLYGPYSAQQYLQEKGFVTVCRVGALTGYHQKYPWVIWAENGTWVRNIDAGWVNPASSTISQTGIANATATASTLSSSYSASIGLYGGPSIYWKTSNSSISGANVQLTGSLYFINTAVSLTLQNGSGSGTITQSNTSPSGSNIYYGQNVAGYINGTASVMKLVTTSSTLPTDPLSLSASYLSLLLTNNAITSSLTGIGALFTSSQDPFNNTILTLPVVSQSFGVCNNLLFNVYGLLSGSIGTYNGTFLSGSNTYDPCTGIWATGSASGSYKVLAVLADTQFGGINTSLEAPGYLGSSQLYSPLVNGATSIGTNFNLYLSQSLDGGYGIYNFSLDSNDPKYITNVFGNDPQAGNPATYAQGTKKEAAYLYKVFEDDIAVIAADPSKWRVSGDAMPSASWTGEPLQFTDRYSLDLIHGDSDFSLTNAATPWVISQKISPWNGGTYHRFPLFRLLTLSDGTDMNTSYKVEISNVKLAGTVGGTDWGTFTLTVRDYSDTDKKPKVLEQFNNLNLDSTSPNFIARRIGDRYNYIRFDGKIIEFGTYNNLSKRIRVEAANNPYPVTAVPYGFQAYVTPINGAIGHWCDPIAYTKASIYSIFPGKYPSGVDFNGPPNGADTELTTLYPTSSTGENHWKDNLQYFAPLPAGSTLGQNNIFALDEVDNSNGVGNGSFLDPSLSGSIPSILDAANETTYVKMRKFVFGFQGGFTGQSPAIPLNTGGNITNTNTQGLNCASSTTAGSIAYNQCIGALSNADEFDINLITVPGIIYSFHPYVTNLVVDMCENRGDVFYILDMYKDDGNPVTSQIDEVVNLANEFDTSYAGTYYPWVKIKDTNINQIVNVPPSTVLPATYAANDRVAGEFWSPAGFSRGGINGAIGVTDRTKQSERDTLYDGKVNPIAIFPGQGVCVWGQKTLQNADSALNRINVRRLLIEIKKFFASVGKTILFEQNTAQTRNRFLSIVNPYLSNIQSRSGLYAFQVIMDDTNNPPDVIDRSALIGQLWLKPTRVVEFIIIPFTVLSQGAIFPSI